jgi:hypothetical protein
MQDCRSLKDLDLNELIAQARGGTLPRCANGAINELRRQRAYRIESAHEIVRGAAVETRALRSDETRAVERHMEEARELEPIIAELDTEQRKVLEGPLHPVAGQYPQLGRETVPGT